MRKARVQVREQVTQMQEGLSRLVGADAWRAVSQDGDDVCSGRMFHVEGAEYRMEFGNDRKVPGRNRPAMLLRHWSGEVWFCLPGSWQEPHDPGFFTVHADDWAFLNKSGAPKDSHLYWWYERVPTSFLIGLEGELHAEKLEQLRKWIVAWYNRYPDRAQHLGGNWRDLQ